MPLPFFFFLLLLDLLLLLLFPPRRRRLLLRLRLEDWSWEDLRRPPPLDELIISIGVDTRLSILDTVETVDTRYCRYGRYGRSLVLFLSLGCLVVEAVAC